MAYQCEHPEQRRRRFGPSHKLKDPPIERAKPNQNALPALTRPEAIGRALV
jgi:hypothetical protein